jgi:hypothetical protein
VTNIQELREIISKLHGVDATHIDSVPVKETFKSRTVWEGVVEVFELIGHPTASRLYAWSHATDDPDKPWRYVTVLHSHPIQSARDAVRAAIVEEFRSNAPAEA